MSYTRKAFQKNPDGNNYTALRDVSAEDIMAMARRLIRHRHRRGATLKSPESTRSFLMLELAEEENEVFACLFLDNRHRIIAFEKLFFGTIDGTSVHPRVVVKRALMLNAAAVIVTHNHPSGTPEPSESDRHITRRLKDSLNLVDIRLLDHIVIGSDQYTSLAERGLL